MYIKYVIVLFNKQFDFLFVFILKDEFINEIEFQSLQLALSSKELGLDIFNQNLANNRHNYNRNSLNNYSFSGM